MLSVVTGVRCASRQWLRRLATTAEFRDLPQAGLCGISNVESGSETSPFVVPCQYHYTVFTLCCPLSVSIHSLHLTTALIRRTSGRTLAPSHKATHLRKSANTEQKDSLVSVVLRRVVVLQTDVQPDERALFFHFLQHALKGEIKNSKRFLTTFTTWRVFWLLRQWTSAGLQAHVA
jgi:hypothetical protein